MTHLARPFSAPVPRLAAGLLLLSGFLISSTHPVRAEPVDYGDLNTSNPDKPRLKRSEVPKKDDEAGGASTPEAGGGRGSQPQMLILEILAPPDTRVGASVVHGHAAGSEARWSFEDFGFVSGEQGARQQIEAIATESEPARLEIPLQGGGEGGSGFSQVLLTVEWPDPSTSGSLPRTPILRIHPGANQDQPGTSRSRHPPLTRLDQVALRDDGRFWSGGPEGQSKMLNLHKLLIPNVNESPEYTGEYGIPRFALPGSAATVYHQLELSLALPRSGN